MRDVAERETEETSSLESQLAELDRQRASGVLSQEEADKREEELLQQLISEWESLEGQAP